MLPKPCQLKRSWECLLTRCVVTAGMEGSCSEGGMPAP